MSITHTIYKSRPALAVTTPAMTALFLPEDGGFVSAIYTASGHRFEMDFGTLFGSALPYLGIWINNGKFKDYYNIALECATAPYDAPDRAERYGYCSEIPRKSAWSFTLQIRVE